MTIEPLKWDSEFFNLKIGKINPNCFSLSDFDAQKNSFDLIYIFEYPDAATLDEIKSTNAALVDRKVIYTKETTSVLLDDNIKEYTAKTASQNLIDLALQSGVYSRFKIDRNFDASFYDRLYLEWIKKSCSREIAFDVLVYGDEKDPDGFITIQQKNNEAHVGLIAVHERARGKGIGKKLMEAAEFVAKNHNFDILKVTTQGDNKQACSLYEKCGFTIDETIHIYHYWNK
ncbi:MAG: GNAT family N-acetyltransferase [Chitinophagales bacterium]